MSNKISLKNFLNHKFGTVWQYIIAIIIFIIIGYVWGVLKSHDYLVFNRDHRDVQFILKFYDRM